MNLNNHRYHVEAYLRSLILKLYKEHGIIILTIIKAPAVWRCHPRAEARAKVRMAGARAPCCTDYVATPTGTRSIFSCKAGPLQPDLFDKPHKKEKDSHL